MFSLLLKLDVLLVSVDLLEVVNLFQVSLEDLAGCQLAELDALAKFENVKLDLVNAFLASLCVRLGVTGTFKVQLGLSLGIWIRAVPIILVGGSRSTKPCNRWSHYRLEVTLTNGRRD